MRHRIINMFLMGHFFRAFGLVLGAVAGIILVFTAISTGAASSKPDMPLSAVMLMGMSEVFMALNVLLPMSVLLGGTIAFWRISRSSELTVIRSVGISVWGFIAPPIIACMLIGAVYITVLNPISAALYRRVQNIGQQYSLDTTAPMLFSQRGLWLKEQKREGVEGYLYAGTVRRDGDALLAQEITAFEVGENSRFLRRIEAASGKLSGESFELSDARIVNPDLSVEIVPSLSYPTQLSVDKIEENSSAPESFSFWRLPGFIEFFEDAGFSTRRHRAQFYSILFMPLLLTAMLFISAIAPISPKRSQANLFLKLSAGIGIGFVTFFMTQVVRAMGASGRIPVILAASSIPIVALLISATVLLALEDG